MAKKRQGVGRRSGEEWRSLITEMVESGEELELFCRRYGIHPPTMRWWQWRLRGSVSGARSAPGSGCGKLAEPRFESIRLATPDRGARSGSFELSWADGLTLRIPEGFDESSLRRLVRVLEEAEC